MADEPKPKSPQAVKGADANLKSDRRRVIIRGVKRGPIISGSYGVFTSISQSTPDEYEDYKTSAMIDRALENVELVRRRMANDQIEIDRLRIETRAMIAELLA